MTIVTNETFQTEVAESKIPVLIDFYADWCMPCKMFAPIFESVAEDFEGKVKFVKVNVDNAPQIAQKYRVISIPTLKLIVNGEEKDGVVGALSVEELQDWVEEQVYGK